MAGPWDKYGASQGTQIKPRDQRLPYQVARDQQQVEAGQYDAPKAQADLARTQQQMQIDRATAPAEIASKQAQARKSSIEADVLEKTGGAGVEQSKAGGFYSRAIKANGMYGQTGVGAPTYGREIAKALLPDSWVNGMTSDERQAAEALQKDFIAATLRYESGAAIPPEELEAQRAIYFPMAGDSENTARLKAQLRANAIEALKIGAGPAADRFSSPNAIDNATQAGNYYAPPNIEAATGDTVTENDPELSAAIDQLIRMGRPPSEIVAYARQQGANTINPAAIMEAQRYLRQNPNYQGSFAAATKTRNTTAAERLAGSALGSYFGGARTALTAGFDDELAGAANALGGGNYTQGRDAFNAQKALQADAHPTANFAGNVTGSVLGMGGLTLGAGRMAANGNRAAAALTARGGLGADAAYGALYGAGQDNQHRLQGAVLGGLAGAAGNTAGQAVAKGLGAAISPSGGELRPLYDLGVRPSIGQRMGGIVNAAEERLQSIPIVGDAIAGTRQRARDQFQTGLFNDALGEIGSQLPEGMGPGHGPHRFAQDAFGRAYDTAERGMTALADQGMAADMATLQQTVGNLADGSQSRFGKIWQDSVARRLQNGQLSGSAYKDAMSDLRKAADRIRRSPAGDGELAAAIQDGMDALRASASRNSSPEAVAAMQAADRGYAKLVQLENASKLAGGDAATFTPSQFERAVKGGESSVRKRGYLAGDALNSDIASLGLRLGDNVPNSASFDRAAWAAGATGVGYVEPNAALGMGLLGAINAPGLRKLTTGIMAPRSNKVAQDIADRIRALSLPLGTVGGATGLSLLPQR